MKRTTAAFAILFFYGFGIATGRMTAPPSPTQPTPTARPFIKASGKKGQKMLASSYVVSGAGDASANGTYTISASPGGINEYQKGDWGLRWDGFGWNLWNDGVGFIAYTGSGGSSTNMDPTWDTTLDGTAPAPTVSEPGGGGGGARRHGKIGAIIRRRN